MDNRHAGGSQNKDQPDGTSQDELRKDKATDASPEQAAFDRFRDAIEQLGETAPLDELANAVQRLIAPKLPAEHASDAHVSTGHRADDDPAEASGPDDA